MHKVWSWHAVSCLWTQLPLQLKLNLWVCLMRLTRCSHAPAQILMVWLEFWSGLLPEYQIQKRETLVCWIFTLMFCFKVKREYPEKTENFTSHEGAGQTTAIRNNLWFSAHQDTNLGYFMNNYTKNNKQRMTHVPCCIFRWLIFGSKKPFR